MADDNTRLSNWFQIISNVAIIVGLGLVIYELNQSKQLAYASMVDQRTARMSARYLAMMGEDPRATLTRAALYPSELVEEDAATLEALYTDITLNWQNLCFTSRLLRIDRSCEPVIENEVRRFFSSAPGRIWLADWIDEMKGIPGMKGIAMIAEQTVSPEMGNYFASRYRALLAQR
jgi:hypothetical protein